MALSDPVRRLIVNADDFGRSHSVNQAVLRAHLEGVLTTASLMVTGDAADEAADIARAHPSLGVGLHLTLVCGKAALPPREIRGLTDDTGEFRRNAAAAGLRYFFQRALRCPLQAEISAQFKKFHQYGLTLDHVNGHLNMHLHPTILRLLLSNAGSWGIRALRLTRDPFWLNARLTPGRWAYRAGHAVIFHWLSSRATRALHRHGIRHTSAVFGLLENSRVNESYIKRLLTALPPGDSELYSHPSLDEFRPELDALVSPAVRELIGTLGIKLIRYQDL